MEQAEKTYLPAAGRDWLLPLYDPLVKLLGGAFTLLDFDGPDARHGFLARVTHSSHHLGDNSEDRILALIGQTGFADPKKIKDGAMLFGYVRTKYYQAYAPH